MRADWTVAGTRRKPVHEESPGSTGQEYRVTPAEGDFRKSATEIYRRVTSPNGDLRENVSFCGEIRYSEVILACRLRPDESYGAGTDEVRVERRGKSSPDGA